MGAGQQEHLFQSSVAGGDVGSPCAGACAAVAAEVFDPPTPQNYSASAQIPERVTWKSKDGKEISGLLYTPRNINTAAKLPAVLWIHGGPEVQDVFRPEGWGPDPVVGMQFGMTGWTPETQPTEDKCLSPYYDKDPKLTGFRGSHWLSGSCTQDYCTVTVMPTDGVLKSHRWRGPLSFDTQLR
jgi:hypothetical protein